MNSLLPQDKIELNKKIVIIINGKGGAGKDTVCEITAQHYRTKIVSAITPIKEIAYKYGWNGEKDKKSRRFLSELKRVFIEYNDLPNRYLEKEYQKFKQSDFDILFVHIRENDQIDDFRRRVSGLCVTLLVRSPKIDGNLEEYGNYSDDHVEDYKYDYYFINGAKKEEIESVFLRFLNTLFLREGILK